MMSQLAHHIDRARGRQRGPRARDHGPVLRDDAGRQPQLAAADVGGDHRGHILFGTDWPAAPEPTVVRNIANLTGFDAFTATQLHAVVRDNALRRFPRFA
jgi:Amidohydrolase